MKITSRQLWLLLCVGMSLFAWTTKAQESTPPFKDVTDVSGINSPRQEGGEKVTGQAWGDYDQDG
ncbi:MAG: hypothetical protein GY943_15105, partial [Chloroflexi bacterium]|nr:hypothetical protein [Chloroflexota bacterium]